MTNQVKLILTKQAQFNKASKIYQSNQSEPIYNIFQLYQSFSKVINLLIFYSRFESMAANGMFNIFTHHQQKDEPDKQKALFCFSIINNGNGDHQIRETVSKRQNFRNEIRKQKNEQIKKNMRSKLLKTLQRNDFFGEMQRLSEGDNSRMQNISGFISQLRKYMNDLQFCQKLNQNDKLKQFILQIYAKNQQQLPLRQKSLLIQSFTYLTYFSANNLSREQKQKINDLMINQISNINKFDCQNTDYLKKLIDLLTNIVADDDKDVNYYLMDTNIFSIIKEKITQLFNQAENASNVKKDHQLVQKYNEDLNDIRYAFLSTLVNLSVPQYQNQQFFQFTINQLVLDINYFQYYGSYVLKIFNNFFHIAKFRERFIQNGDLVCWFEKWAPQICQSRFIDKQSIKTGKFNDTKMTVQERQLFYQFLSCFMTWNDYQIDEAYQQQMQTIIEHNLNGYCLSQFLIQCSQNTDDHQTIRRNSKYVAMAIRMYEYLACDQNINLDQLLIVTSQRNPQDIIKVFLDQTYFTSCKIADLTISTLNKMLSKNPQLLKTYIELGIFDRIEDFLFQQPSIQTSDQIINFLELLLLMIASDDDLKKQNHKNGNNVATLLQKKGFIKRIQVYQDLDDKSVYEKAQSFLSYFGQIRKQVSGQDTIQI